MQVKLNESLWVINCLNFQNEKKIVLDFYNSVQNCRTEEIPEISMSFDVTDNLGAGRASSNSNGIAAGECFYWVEDPSPTITIK